VVSIDVCVWIYLKHIIILYDLLCTFLVWNFASLALYTHVLCFTDLFHILLSFLINSGFRVCVCVCVCVCVHVRACVRARNISVMPPCINPASLVSSGHYSCHCWIAPTSFNLSVFTFSTSFCEDGFIHTQKIQGTLLGNWKKIEEGKLLIN
jgi:hypothetical protein